MAVIETGVSYYGISHLEHAEKDFDEMVAHNCNAVLLALTEFDLFFWKPNIPRIVDLAKKKGLAVYLNTWGIGKFFGGEPPSLFLQECDVADRQHTALTGEPLPAASPSSPSFREYFWGHIDWLAAHCDADGLFWDEPHYAMPVQPVSYQSTADWSCRSPLSQRAFKDRYGYELPKSLTYQVKQWRHQQANEILIEASRVAKRRNPALTVTQCSLPAENNFYVSLQRGFDDWESIAGREDVDVFSTSIIIDYATPLSTHERIATKTADLAHAHGKRAQRWVMSYMESPKEMETIAEIVRLYDRCGIDSIFSWTYRAGMGTFLSAPEPKAAWDMLGHAYGEVLNK